MFFPSRVPALQGFLSAPIHKDVEGAYAAVNCEFARYLRLKYPDAAFLDREDDMGLEGLRKAKLSYNPHHLVSKHWAYLTEDIHGD